MTLRWSQNLVLHDEAKYTVIYIYLQNFERIQRRFRGYVLRVGMCHLKQIGTSYLLYIKATPLQGVLCFTQDIPGLMSYWPALNFSTKAIGSLILRQLCGVQPLMDLIRRGVTD